MYSLLRAFPDLVIIKICQFNSQLPLLIKWFVASHNRGRLRVLRLSPVGNGTFSSLVAAPTQEAPFVQHLSSAQPRIPRGVASQKVMEGQACPHETLKIIHDRKKG